MLASLTVDASTAWRLPQSCTCTDRTASDSARPGGRCRPKGLVAGALGASIPAPTAVMRRVVPSDPRSDAPLQLGRRALRGAPKQRSHPVDVAGDEGSANCGGLPSMHTSHPQAAGTHWTTRSERSPPRLPAPVVSRRQLRRPGLRRVRTSSPWLPWRLRTLDSFLASGVVFCRVGPLELVGSGLRESRESGSPPPRERRHGHGLSVRDVPPGAPSRAEDELRFVEGVQALRRTSSSLSR